MSWNWKGPSYPLGEVTVDESETGWGMWTGMALASAGHKFLHSHAVVDIPHINRSIFSERNVMTPIDLSIVISESAPLREDFSIQIQLEDASPVRRPWLQVATVNRYLSRSCCAP